MKRFLAGIGMAMAVMSCSEKTPTTLAGQGEEPATAEVSIFNITASGFTDNNGQELLSNDLTKGDAIGLFIVHADGSVDDPLRMTLRDDGTWNIASNATDIIQHTEGDQYYAFYPYSSSVTAKKVDPSSADADGFFAGMIADWNVQENQSSANGFKSSLLMAAKGSLDINGDDYSISAVLEPKTVLAALTAGSIRYIFDNTPSIPDYIIPVSVSFDQIKPLFDNGTYYIQMNPAKGAVISCTVSGEKWSEDLSDAKPGSATVFSFSKTSEKHHTLQTGDFFLADGNLLPKDADEAVVKAATVIGIVTNINPERISQSAKEALGGTVHGTVTSAKEAPAAAWHDSATDHDESDIGLVPKASHDYSAQQNAAALDSDIDGYGYTKAILEKRADDVAKNLYGAFSQTQTFAETAGGPAVSNTTGWYLPAMGEMFDFFRATCGIALSPDDEIMTGYDDGETKDDTWMWWDPVGVYPAAEINKALAKVADGNKTVIHEGQEDTIWYWTSSVLSAGQAYSFVYTPSSFGTPTQKIECQANYKNMTAVSRLMLVF